MLFTTLKVGDRFPSLSAVLRDANGVVDLSAALSVVLRMRHETEGTLITGTCTIEDAEGGEVNYDWASGDTDVAGRYLCEFLVTWSGSIQATFPNEGAFYVIIAARV